jgi:hypothetical protein
MKVSCKVVKEKQTIADKLKKLEEENERLKKVDEENKQLKKIIEQSNNTTNIINDNSTNINNTINNITIVAHGKEDYDLINDKEIIKAFGYGYHAAVKLITAVHFNPRYPNFHNVYVQNMKEKYCTIYDGKKWISKLKKDIIDDLYENNKDYIEENLDKYRGSLSQSKINSLHRWLDTDAKNSDSDAILIGGIKEKIHLSAYNERCIPKNTIKLIKQQELNHNN